jgi:hypothetical protein
MVIVSGSVAAFSKKKIDDPYRRRHYRQEDVAGIPQRTGGKIVTQPSISESGWNQPGINGIIYPFSSAFNI